MTITNAIDVAKQRSVDTLMTVIVEFDDVLKSAARLASGGGEVQENTLELGHEVTRSNQIAGGIARHLA